MIPATSNTGVQKKMGKNVTLKANQSLDDAARARQKTLISPQKINTGTVKKSLRRETVKRRERLKISSSSFQVIMPHLLMEHSIHFMTLEIKSKPKGKTLGLDLISRVIKCMLCSMRR